MCEIREGMGQKNYKCINYFGASSQTLGTKKRKCVNKGRGGKKSVQVTNLATLAVPRV